MATEKVTVPDIGDFDKVPVIEVLVSAGDRVEKEDSLITLESDKATMEVPAPGNGTVSEVMVGVGDEVQEGDVILMLEAEEEEGSEQQSESDADSQPQQSSAEPDDAADEQSGDLDESSAEADQDAQSQSAEGGEPDSGDSNGGSAGSDQHRASPERDSPVSAGERRSPPVAFGSGEVMPDQVPYATPLIRRLARELGVDLDQVKGSGEGGRILEEDVKGFVKQAMSGQGGAGTPQATSGPGLAVAAPPKVDFSKFGEISEEPLSRIKKISGPSLHRNWVSIPHVTQFDQADITELEAFRKDNKDMAEDQGVKLTPLVFIMKAVVSGLRRMPHFNASLSADGESLVLKHYFHIGIAVDTDGGLMVPVVKDVDKKGLLELAEELADLSSRAREGKLKSDEMKGGCFSISSLGGIGGTAFTPIINAPEVAILGVSRHQMQPVWDGEAFQPRLMLPLSLSYDHRVIDGAGAARFTRYLATRLEDTRRLLL